MAEKKLLEEYADEDERDEKGELKVQNSRQNDRRKVRIYSFEMSSFFSFNFAPIVVAHLIVDFGCYKSSCKSVFLTFAQLCSILNAFLLQIN